MKTAKHWEKIGKKSHHGICIPLFALRTERSCGGGEFLDLLPLISWCANIGFDCLQLLPLNDTGADPSPFSAVSSCALDPIYLSLSALPDADTDLNAFRSLNALPRFARNEVKNLKTKWLHRYFEKTFSSIENTSKYQTFLSQNPWLSAYARFKALKDEFNGRHWKEWPVSYESATPKKNAVNYYSFLQFHCFSQLEQVRAFAALHSVFLKGDLPILLSPDSADVWANRSLFHLHLTAGAPPDYYNALGQNWGFPLYNWEAMRNQGFSWWKQRLKILERFYHIYRIDHVVGFFRIWGIPEGNPASDGYFIPTDPSAWPTQGKELLEMMIDACSLLPIAEDLGTIPSEVYAILKQLGICGTKVLRWQRRGGVQGDYIPYDKYEPLSLTIVSNADMSPLPLWWQKFPEEAAAFAQFKHWVYKPTLSADKHLSILRDAHSTSSYFHINPLQEYLFPFPELVWPDLQEERINIPGTTLPTNWTYRIKPFFEEIATHRGLTDAIRTILPS